MFEGRPRVCEFERLFDYRLGEIFAFVSWTKDLLFKPKAWEACIDIDN